MRAPLLIESSGDSTWLFQVKLGQLTKSWTYIVGETGQIHAAILAFFAARHQSLDYYESQANAANPRYFKATPYLL